MLKFRKNELFWLKSHCFRCANSRKRQFQGQFSRGKRVESGVSLVKCVISVHVQLRSPTNVLLEKTQKNPVPPHSGIVQTVVLEYKQWNRRLEARKRPLFRDKISEFRAVEGR